MTVPVAKQPDELLRENPGAWVFRVVLRRTEQRLVVLCSHHSTQDAYALLHAQFPKAGLHVLQRGAVTP